jgi:plasmid stabilization system protein ParE
MLGVRTTPEADVQILEIHNWWRANRRAAPALFAEELAAAFEMIAHAPTIGRPYRQSPVFDTRRVLLKATRYHVYSVANPGEVRVLAVWHGRRGVGPPLRG